MSSISTPPPSRRSSRSFTDVLGAVVVFAVGALVIFWVAGLFRNDTVVVTGTAPEASLATFAASLPTHATS